MHDSGNEQTMISHSEGKMTTIDIFAHSKLRYSWITTSCYPGVPYVIVKHYIAVDIEQKLVTIPGLCCCLQDHIAFWQRIQDKHCHPLACHRLQLLRRERWQLK